MLFKVNTVQTDMVIDATNRDLEGRWIVVTPEELTRQLGEDFSWSNKLDKELKPYRVDEITRPCPGFDDLLGRPVILKVLNYTDEEFLDKELAFKKRKALEDQIRLLNDLSSPLLAEPLDYFTVTNASFVDEELRNSEPVLVLDYLSGDTLSVAFEKKRFNRFETTKEEGSNNKFGDLIDKGLNINKMCMFISRIIGFVEHLNEKGYMFLGLKPEHILVLKNEVPRFLGIGKICKVKDGKFDQDDLKFKTMMQGYSAPELHSPETNFGQDADALAAGIYSIGVILAQIMYGDFNLYHDTLENGSIAYPNKRYQEKVLNNVPEKGQQIDRLLTKMCNPNPKKRLVDLREINLTLKEIGGIMLEEEKVELKQIKENNKLKKQQQYQNRNNNNNSNKNNQKTANTQNNNTDIKIPQAKQNTFATAVVTSFDKANNCGYAENKKTGEKIKITSELMSSSNLKYLTKGLEIKLIYEHMDNGYKLLQRVYYKPTTDKGEGTNKPPKDDGNSSTQIAETKSDPPEAFTPPGRPIINKELDNKIKYGLINIDTVLVEEKSNLKKINEKYPGQWHFKKGEVVLKDKNWTITDGKLVSRKLLLQRKRINEMIERGEVNIRKVLIEEKSNFDAINSKYPGKWTPGANEPVVLMDLNWTIENGMLKRVESPVESLIKSTKSWVSKTKDFFSNLSK